MVSEYGRSLQIQDIRARCCQELWWPEHQNYLQCLRGLERQRATHLSVFDEFSHHQGIIQIYRLYCNCYFESLCHSFLMFKTHNTILFYRLLTTIKYLIQWSMLTVNTGHRNIKSAFVGLFKLTEYFSEEVDFRLSQ